MVIWLVIAAVLVIAEIATMGLATIWFAGGAVVAALTAMMGAHWIVQFLVFAVVSLVLLIFTRPVATRHFMKEQEKTNADGLVGQRAIVTEEIDNARGAGAVKVNGLEWSARTVDGAVVEEGKEVVIDSISGVKLIVRLN